MPKCRIKGLSFSSLVTVIFLCLDNLHFVIHVGSFMLAVYSTLSWVDDSNPCFCLLNLLPSFIFLVFFDCSSRPRPKGPNKNESYWE